MKEAECDSCLGTDSMLETQQHGLCLDTDSKLETG